MAFVMKIEDREKLEAAGVVVSALLWGAVIGTLISGMLSSKDSGETNASKMNRLGA